MDVFSTADRSRVMSMIRGTQNQRTEMVMVKILRAYGITGWRRHLSLPGKPDFTFRTARMVVFVDGCFWHSCSKHGRSPGTNQDYWLPKLARNKRRDQRISRTLRAKGWCVLRFWEHDLQC